MVESMSKEYRKKPVVIKAVQFDGSDESHAECMEFMGKQPGEQTNVGMLFIDTLEGTMCAMKGDYIIRGVRGEFYPCHPGIFEDTYEPAQWMDRFEQKPVNKSHYE